MCYSRVFPALFQFSEPVVAPATSRVANSPFSFYRATDQQTGFAHRKHEPEVFQESNILLDQPPNEQTASSESTSALQREISAKPQSSSVWLVDDDRIVMQPADAPNPAEAIESAAVSLMNEFDQCVPLLSPDDMFPSEHVILREIADMTKRRKLSFTDTIPNLLSTAINLSILRSATRCYSLDLRPIVKQSLKPVSIYNSETVPAVKFSLRKTSKQLTLTRPNPDTREMLNTTPPLPSEPRNSCKPTSGSIVYSAADNLPDLSTIGKSMCSRPASKDIEVIDVESFQLIDSGSLLAPMPQIASLHSESQQLHAPVHFSKVESNADVACSATKFIAPQARSFSSSSFSSPVLSLKSKAQTVAPSPDLQTVAPSPDLYLSPTQAQPLPARRRRIAAIHSDSDTPPSPVIEPVKTAGTGDHCDGVNRSSLEDSFARSRRNALDGDSAPFSDDLTPIRPAVKRRKKRHTVQSKKPLLVDIEVYSLYLCVLNIYLPLQLCF
jgi:hypothetical protein